MTPIYESDQATGTACNACGDCCDPVLANFDIDEDPAGVIDLPAAESLRFARDHWTKLGTEGSAVVYSCSFFDPESRLCTAHEKRPPICRAFPWGLKEREHLDALSALKIRRYPECEFWADLPPEVRPEGWEPVLLSTRPRGA